MTTVIRGRVVDIFRFLVYSLSPEQSNHFVN